MDCAVAIGEFWVYHQESFNPLERRHQIRECAQRDGAVTQFLWCELAASNSGPLRLMKALRIFAAKVAMLLVMLIFCFMVNFLGR